MFSYFSDLILSYVVLAITFFVILYRFSKLIKDQNLWDLPIFLAGSFLSLIGAFSVTLYLQSVPVINEIADKFGFQKWISAIPETKSDGDNLIINGQNFRLIHIEAPELGQCCKTPNGLWTDCGMLAQKKLQDKIRDRRVSCTWKNKGSYNRPLATCFVGDENINEWLVREGYAFVYHKWKSRTKSYIEDETYLKQQEKAASENRGLHAYNSLTLPHLYRHRKKLSRFKYPDCDGQ